MATPHHLPKNRGALKSTQITFLRAPNFSVSHNVGKIFVAVPMKVVVEI